MQEGSLYHLSYQKDTLWLTKIKVGDEKKDRNVSKVIIYGLSSEVTHIKGVTSSDEAVVEGQKTKEGGFKF